MRPWQGVAIGIGVGLAFAAASNAIGRIVAPQNEFTSERPWVFYVVSWVSFVAMLAPGFIAGYLCGRRGFLLGALAGFAYDVIRTAFFGVQWDSPIPLLTLAGILIGGALQPAVLGAMCGGSGELLKRAAVPSSAT